MNELRFDKDGRIILPQIIKEDNAEQRKREEEAKKFDKKLILKYVGSENEGFIRCEFEIEFPYDVKSIRKKSIEVRDWANKNVELKERARCWIEKNGDDYRLIISGRGNDGRCTWCRSFRTALSTTLFDLKVAVCQKDSCKFDKGSYRKVKIEKS
ncbi:MAG: hypothetical protein Q8N63_03315 [Nanoarchaeota archaeon]|nr:hypothetical protein [Nanoarchaeota archaeon]